MPPKNKNKKFLAAQKKAAAEKAEKAAKEEAERVAREGVEKHGDANGNGQGTAENGEGSGGRSEREDANSASESSGRIRARPTPEDLGFFVRSGPDNAALRHHANMDIRIGDILLSAGKQTLIQNGVLALNYGTKYGLIGRNGVGKSTLLRALSERRIPLPSFLHVIHVEQEVVGDERTVLQTVLEADRERDWLLREEERLLAMEPEEEALEAITLNEIYERLDELDSDSAESRAAMVLTGLGFDGEMQGKPTQTFSGGWRMRIALAQALFMQPDLLLLDEPSNHLDVHALLWLQEFLNAWEKTVVIVSHDRGLLNSVTRATIFLNQKRLRYYGGNYNTFLRVRAEHRANQAATLLQQERRKADLKQFVARFGHGHRKMARQAQSRMKMLEKIEETAAGMLIDRDDPYLRLDFPAATRLPPPCVSVVDMAFGYDADKPLYCNLNFGVDCDSRIAIIGPNGAGKSTFLKVCHRLFILCTSIPYRCRRSSRPLALSVVHTHPSTQTSVQRYEGENIH